MASNKSSSKKPRKPYSKTVPKSTTKKNVSVEHGDTYVDGDTDIDTDIDSDIDTVDTAIDTQDLVVDKDYKPYFTTMSATPFVESSNGQRKKKIGRPSKSDPRYVNRVGHKYGPASLDRLAKNPMAQYRPRTQEDHDRVSRMLQESLAQFMKPRVTNDEELFQRFAEYFTECAQSGQVPTVEELALSTGYSVETLYRWESGRAKGFSEKTGALVKRAKHVIRSFDAKNVSEGKLNPVVYFFRAKNYYGMRDQQDVIVTPNVSETALSVEDIKERYDKDVIDVTEENVKRLSDGDE